LLQLGCDDKDLSCLGVGYPLYYFLQRRLFLTFLDLSIFIGGICLVIVATAEGSSNGLFLSVVTIFTSNDV
jgi:hypothetical protein